MKKRERLFAIACEKCGYEPSGEKKGNWIEIKNLICPKCGGEIIPMLREDSSKLKDNR